jgi:glycosyltransferase involved in cell wall biosynthesis
VIVYSKSAIGGWNLSRFSKKIIIVYEHFIDTDHFHVIISIDHRENIIGFVGRFSHEKGIISFIRAIPGILSDYPDHRFLIIGSGPLEYEVKQFLSLNNLNNKVTVVPWVEYQDIPEYLNKMKVLILPSFTEGLPNVVLEALACGTPVLVTRVGSLVDLIEDGINGFFLEDNSPDSIKKGVISVIENQNKDKIVTNGLNLILTDYTYQKALERYENVLKTL